MAVPENYPVNYTWQTLVVGYVLIIACSLSFYHTVSYFFSSQNATKKEICIKEIKAERSKM